MTEFIDDFDLTSIKPKEADDDKKSPADETSIEVTSVDQILNAGMTSDQTNDVGEGASNEEPSTTDESSAKTTHTEVTAEEVVDTADQTLNTSITSDQTALEEGTSSEEPTTIDENSAKTTHTEVTTEEVVDTSDQTLNTSMTSDQTAVEENASNEEPLDTSDKSTAAPQQDTDKDYVDEQYKDVHGICTFPRDLSAKQKEVIVKTVLNAFDRVMDIDILARYDNEAAHWMNNDPYAQETFTSNHNLCYYLHDKIMNVIDHGYVRSILKANETVEQLEEPKKSQYKDAISKALMINRVVDISMTAKDIGLIDNVIVFRDENDMLQLKVKWCLTAAKVDRSEAENIDVETAARSGQFRKGCPSGAAIEKIVLHSLTQEYKKLLDPQYWENEGAEMPKDLSKALVKPVRRKTVEDETGIEDGSPYDARTRFNEDLRNAKAKEIEIPIVERLTKRLADATN